MSDKRTETPGPGSVQPDGLAIASASPEDQERIMSILERWARDNPRWRTNYGVEQDPMGIHALLARLRAPNARAEARRENPEA